MITTLPELYAAGLDKQFYDLRIASISKDMDAHEETFFIQVKHSGRNRTLRIERRMKDKLLAVPEAVAKIIASQLNLYLDFK